MHLDLPEPQLPDATSARTQQGDCAPAWYCLQTQPKHEHIAAAHLQHHWNLEVYLPRIRFKRPTRQGPVWQTEPMFPNYLFARFPLLACHRKVHHAPGVRGIVHFGDTWPVIPAAAIDELRAAIGAEHVHVVSDELQPGDPVLIAGGAFHNLAAVVTRVMSSRQRVAVLLDFLGRQTAVELDRRTLVKQGAVRPDVLWGVGKE